MSYSNDVPIPVIMFHTVRPVKPSWFWNHLSHSPDLFESYLRYLKSKRYTTVLLPELMDHIYGRTKLPARSVALTFDDGYLDNWTILAPILKKYDYCGTVFVNPEFVDPRDTIRQQVMGRAALNVSRDLVDGFMSWEELKAVQASGVLDVQAHGMSHTWYPSSGNIIDFHHPGDRYPWLAWNAYPDRKHLWMAEDQSELVEFGTPVYEHGKSFVVQRYFEREETKTCLVEHVRKNGGKDFFRRQNWRDELFAIAKKNRFEGYTESPKEYRVRVLWELRTCKEQISSRLGKPVDIICWPGGGYNDVTLGAAREVGYSGWTVRAIANVSGRNTREIGRISTPVVAQGSPDCFINRLVFQYQLEGYRGSAGWAQAKRVVRRLRKLADPRSYLQPCRDGVIA